MSGTYSRREFVSLLGSAAASALAACGGAPTPTDPESNKPGEPARPSTIIVTKDGDDVVATARNTGDVIARNTNAGQVIQTSLDEVESGGVVRVHEGTYTVEITEGTGRVTLPSEVTLEGEGPGSTVLKMADGVNMDAHPILGTGPDAEQAVIRDLEVDGNESGNRNIEPFPGSPHGHGIDVHGTNNRVENVFVHDTIRSNITLHGTNCTLESLRLKNSATDHWLYFTNAEQCTVTDVHASGFARGDGFVFGVGKNTVRDNVLANVVIEGATTTPRAEGDTSNLRLLDYFPTNAVIFRAEVNTSDNTVENLVVRDPDHPAGQAIFLGHPGATLQGYEYRGPAGYYEQMIRVGSAAGGVPGAQVSDVSVQVTNTNPNGASAPAVLASRSSDVTVEGLEISGATSASLRGVVFDGEHRSVDNNTVKSATIETDGPAVFADGSENPVIDLAVLDVTDVACSGVKTKGEVTFAKKDITCP